jgi:hypothetical protein
MPQRVQRSSIISFLIRRSWLRTPACGDQVVGCLKIRQSSFLAGQKASNPSIQTSGKLEIQKSFCSLA